MTLFVSGLAVASSAGPAASDEHSAPPPSYALSTELEEFVTNQSMLLRSIWAGSKLVGDNRMEVALTTDRAPEVLKRPEIVLVKRAHTTEELDASMEVVTSRLNELLAPGVEPGSKAEWPYVAQVNYDANAVDVQLVDQNRRADVERSLKEEIDAGRVRVVEGKAPPQHSTHCVGRLHCDHPFRGGTRVEGTPSGGVVPICTLGFVMVNNANGDREQSTASHCAGSPWTHDFISIGSTVFTQDSGAVDFKVIRQNNESQPAPTNWVLRNGGTVAITLKQASPGSQGTTICHTGHRGGDSCAPITSTNKTFQGRSGFGAFGPMSTCHGDSGSAVLNNANNRAYGSMTGFEGADADCVSGRTGVFTWINKAEAAANRKVLLTPTNDTLAPGQRMSPGYALVASNGTYNLQMQGDGNFVIYLNGVAQWSTATNGNPGAYAVMQNDGNLVVYRSDGHPLWARPGATRVAGSRLVMQTDGNLVVRTPSWAAAWHRFCGC